MFQLVHHAVCIAAMNSANEFDLFRVERLNDVIGCFLRLVSKFELFLGVFVGAEIVNIVEMRNRWIEDRLFDDIKTVFRIEK